MAAPPHPPREKLQFTGRLCAPIQRNIDEIPVILFDAALGVQHYTDFMVKRTNRAVGIAPATLYGSPITTIENPQNRREDPKTEEKVLDSGASHHIIQMRYSAQKEDPTLAVQLLVNDVNGYITAKRVRRSVWGRWQQFTDIDGAEVPEFLDAEVVDVPASHDVVGKVRRFVSSLLEKKGKIIVELDQWDAGRCSSGIRRLLGKEPASLLSELAWARIGSWKVLSRFLIRLAKYGKKLDAELALKLVSFGAEYGLSTFEELTGELLVLRYSDEFLLTNQVKKRLAHKKAGMNIQDPKFPRA